MAKPTTKSKISLSPGDRGREGERQRENTNREEEKKTTDDADDDDAADDVNASVAVGGLMLDIQYISASMLQDADCEPPANQGLNL